MHSSVSVGIEKCTVRGETPRRDVVPSDTPAGRTGGGIQGFAFSVRVSMCIPSISEGK